MSYPGGFSRLFIGDRGTQRMAQGEDNVENREGEGPSSTSSKEVSSCVDSARVIMWLRLIRGH